MDIPGTNTFTPNDQVFYSANEEVLCDGIVKYPGQPVGIIVAESADIAEKAAKLVKISCKPGKKPVFDVKEAKKDPARLSKYLTKPATERGTNVTKVIKGSNTLHGQFHVPTEPLTVVTVPTDDCLKVYATTQWADGVHIVISRALNIAANR